MSPDIVGIASAAPVGQYAAEMQLDGRYVGVFSGNFLRALREPKADLDKNGMVSLQEAVRLAQSRLDEEGRPQKAEVRGNDTDLALFSLDPARDRSQGRLNALLIGVDEIKDLHQLRGPSNDARLFEALLDDREYVLAGETEDDVSIEVLLNENATAERIREALDRLAAKPGTTTLVFFSGLATSQTVARGESTMRVKAMVPYDAKTAGYISVPEMADRLSKSPARYKVLIVDG